MRVCEATSTAIDVNLSPTQNVAEVKSILSRIKNCTIDCIKLIYKGHLLQNNHSLNYYGVNTNSVLHMVKSQKSNKHLDDEKNSDTSDSNDLCTNSEVISVPANISSEAMNNDYGETVIDSLVKHVFGDQIYLMEGNSKSIPIEEIHYTLSSYPNIMKLIVQSPLVQDILGDRDLTRSLLLTNPMIIEFIELNPGLEDYLSNDDNIQELVSIFTDSHSYDNYSQTRKVILEKVEDKLGFPLQFSEEYNRRMSEIDIKLQEQEQELQSTDSSPLQESNQPVESPNALFSACRPLSSLVQDSKLTIFQMQAKKKAGSHHTLLRSIFSKRFQNDSSSNLLTHSHMDVNQRNQTSVPNLWQESENPVAASTPRRQDRNEHINLLCQIASNRPDIFFAYMKKTPLYKEIEKTSPGLLTEILNPDRLRLLSKPEMIRSLIRMDQAVEQLNSVNHGVTAKKL